MKGVVGWGKFVVTFHGVVEYGCGGCLVMFISVCVDDRIGVL